MLKNKIYFILFAILVFPITINAQSVSIKCDKESISIDESVNCTISGKSTDEVRNIVAVISHDDDIEIKNIEIADELSGKSSLNLNLSTDGLVSDFHIVSFNVSSSGVGTHKIYVKNIKFDENNVNNAELAISVKSSNNILKDIKISNTDFKYDSSKTEFSIEVDNDIKEVEITAVIPDDGAVLTGEGKKTLKDGSNVFKLNCKAENGDLKTYTITIKRLTKEETEKQEEEKKKEEARESEKASNNYLSKLNIKEATISFNKTLTNYNITVESNISSLTLEYDTEVEKSTVEVKGNENFKTGKNKVEIIVKSEDGKTKTYTINVEKKEEKIELDNDTKKIMEALNNAESKSAIYVKVKEIDDNKKVDKDILNAIKDMDKTVIYQVINSNDKILYTVTLNKNSVSELKEFDYTINFKSDNEKLIKKILNDDFLQIVFNNKENTSNKIKFKINLQETKLSDAESLYLYKYDSEKNELVIVKDNLKLENGYVTIDVNEFDEYVLTKVDTDLKVTNNSKGNRAIIILSLIIVISIVITIMVIISEKSKKNKNNKEIK